MSRPDATSTSAWQVDLAAALILAALTGAVYLVGIQPIIERQADLIAQRQQLQQQKRKAEELTATLTTLRNQLVQVRAATKESKIQLQPTGRLNRHMAEVTDLADECELNVHEVQPGEVKEGQRYETVPITLAGDGDYAACARFLHRLHDAFPDTGVRSFRVQSRRRGDGERTRFRFVLHWHAAPSLSDAS